jgi:hypothetical protein
MAPAAKRRTNDLEQLREIEMREIVESKDEEKHLPGTDLHPRVHITEIPVSSRRPAPSAGLQSGNDTVPTARFAMGVQT